MEDKGKNKKLCLALGFFDCMHAGHRVIANEVMSYCKKRRSFEPAIFTFNDDFAAYKSGGKIIYTLSERTAVYKECGFNTILSFDFAQVRDMQPFDFLRELSNSYDVGAFVCGCDFAFGKNRSGSVKDIKRFALENGLDLTVVDEIINNGERVSSSRIKELLSDGKTEEANLLLRRPFFIRGKVVHGRGVGRTFFVPTANIEVASVKFLPMDGVYASVARVDGREYYSVTNIGTKPSFDDFTRTVECHIIGLKSDIYDKEITVELIRYLRPIQKFSSVDKLRAQIEKDEKWSET